MPLVLQLVGPIRSVVDIGGGDGGWLRMFQKLGCKKIMLFDHADVRPHLVINPDSFQPVDLGQDDMPTGRADLAVCLECAEHLPEARAGWLVHSLTSCADVVLFSAAVPGQGGKGHVNEQPHAYWHDLFSRRGFRCVDSLRGRIVHDRSIPWWYRQNLFFYVSERSALLEGSTPFLPDDMCLLHRDIVSRLMHCGVRERLRLLAGDLRRALFRG